MNDPHPAGPSVTQRAQDALKLDRARQNDAKAEEERVEDLKRRCAREVEEIRLRYTVEAILRLDARHVKIVESPHGSPQADVDGVILYLLNNNLYAPGVGTYVTRLEDFAVLLEKLNKDDAPAAIDAGEGGAS